MSVSIKGTTGVTAPGFTGNGSGLTNLYSGAMLQFQHTLFTGTTYNDNIHDVMQDITGISVSITPKFANSKMKVEVRWGGECLEAWDTIFNITRNGTPVNLPDAIDGNVAARGLAMPSQTYTGSNNASTPEVSSFWTVDTPNTLDPITYQLTVVAYNGRNGAMWSGRCFTLGQGAYERMSCEITVTEIAVVE